MKKSLTQKFGIYSAMGVAGGMTFATTSAEADIIFTPFSGSASFNDPLDIDIDGDGTTDFVFDINDGIANNYGTNSNWALIDAGAGGNQFAAIDPSPLAGGPSYGPNNLANGAIISSGLSFAGGSGPLQLAYMSYASTNNFGAFNTTTPTGYIGVQFQSGGGNDVFGWIGVEVSGDVTNDGIDTAEILVNGFAYESNGGPLPAGLSVVPEPSSLGLLALGAAGMATRRRKKS